MALAQPEPGDFCCVPVSGAVGFGIQAGQWLDGDKFQPYDHTEVYVGQPDREGPFGYTVSTYPNGHGRRRLPCLPAQVPGSLWSSGLYDLTDVQRAAVVSWAGVHEDTGYSFADYGALFLRMMHVPAPGLGGYIRSTGHMICSQFVDAAWEAAGVHLFDDKRWPGYVKPGDLARLLQARMPSSAANPLA